MAKRFIETTIWTQNQWFRKLPLEFKLFWIYLLTNCDSVGVWEEDFELVSFIIGREICKEEAYSHLGDRIELISDKKVWIKDFCHFQYDILSETSTSPPIISYICRLKKHNLWEAYRKGIERVKDKDKDKEQDKDSEKEEDKTSEEDKNLSRNNTLFNNEDYTDSSVLPF